MTKIIASLQPSQYYLSEDKLRAVRDWLTKDEAVM